MCLFHPLASSGREVCRRTLKEGGMRSSGSRAATALSIGRQHLLQMTAPRLVQSEHSWL
jgi:hypothetical protein